MTKTPRLVIDVNILIAAIKARENSLAFNSYIIALVFRLTVTILRLPKREGDSGKSKPSAGGYYNPYLANESPLPYV